MLAEDEFGKGGRPKEAIWPIISSENDIVDQEVLLHRELLIYDREGGNMRRVEVEKEIQYLSTIIFETVAVEDVNMITGQMECLVIDPRQAISAVWRR